MPRTVSRPIVQIARAATRPGGDASERRRKRAPAVMRNARKAPSAEAVKARRKFLKVFPNGFRDETYLEWERGYKWDAHQRWERELSEPVFRALLVHEGYERIAATALSIESRTNLLFSFEKMALRDAVRPPAGAKSFALGLFAFLYGADSPDIRFGAWIDMISRLPRRKTRVLTWPLATVFGFIAQPRSHFFFKPTVTREAAHRYGTELDYVSRPSWPVYRGLLQFVNSVRQDIRDLRPRDMIDLQSSLWVQGSVEYPD
jgi:hypothetical protein